MLILGNRRPANNGKVPGNRRNRENMSSETDRAVAVKCNHCEYMTADGDLETCPECGLADALMDMDAETVALQWNARRAAANAHDALVEACEKMWGFWNDLAGSNPGFLGKLCLQDYAQFNEAMIAMPAALALARGVTK